MGAAQTLASDEGQFREVVLLDRGNVDDCRGLRLAISSGQKSVSIPRPHCSWMRQQMLWAMSLHSTSFFAATSPLLRTLSPNFRLISAERRLHVGPCVVVLQKLVAPEVEVIEHALE